MQELMIKTLTILSDRQFLLTDEEIIEFEEELTMELDLGLTALDIAIREKFDDVRIEWED